MAKRHYLILTSDMTPVEWAHHINDNLNPYYEWLGNWKPATVVVGRERNRAGEIFVLEAFLLGLGVGCAIDTTMSIKICDCSSKSKVLAAICEWFQRRYPKCFLEPALKTAEGGKLVAAGKSKKGGKKC